MEHSFNVQFAQKYGIEEAIIVQNFYFWLRKNIANEKHLHDGRYWTYNSNNAFTQLFPYINKTKIFRVLKHLEECDIILKDNFNTSVWDKTLWYSFSDHGLCELHAFGYDVTDFGKMNHRDNQSETTIPYNKHTDNNEEKEIDKSISKKKNRNAFDVRKDLSYVEEVFVQIWNEWLDYKDEIGKQYKTQRGANSQYKSLVKYANNNPILANAIVKRSIEHSWDGVFALTDKQVELFLSSKSPYFIVENNEQPTTQHISETIIINGQIYK